LQGNEEIKPAKTQGQHCYDDYDTSASLNITEEILTATPD